MRLPHRIPSGDGRQGPGSDARRRSPVFWRTTELGPWTGVGSQSGSDRPVTPGQVDADRLRAGRIRDAGSDEVDRGPDGDQTRPIDIRTVNDHAPARDHVWPTGSRTGGATGSRTGRAISSIVTLPVWRARPDRHGRRLAPRGHSRIEPHGHRRELRRSRISGVDASRDGVTVGVSYRKETRTETGDHRAGRGGDRGVGWKWAVPASVGAISWMPDASVTRQLRLCPGGC